GGARLRARPPFRLPAGLRDRRGRGGRRNAGLQPRRGRRRTDPRHRLRSLHRRGYRTDDDTGHRRRRRYRSAVTLGCCLPTGSALYRSRVLDEVPGDLPEEATEIVSSNLGAAISVTEQLPTEAATHLADLARHAFIDGLGAATVTGGFILVTAAIVCPLLLHRGRNHSQSTHSPADTGKR